MSTHPWREGMRHPNYHVPHDQRQAHRREYQRRWLAMREYERTARLIFARLCSRGHSITGPADLVWGKYGANCARCFADQAAERKAARPRRANA